MGPPSSFKGLGMGPICTQADSPMVVSVVIARNQVLVAVMTVLPAIVCAEITLSLRIVTLPPRLTTNLLFTWPKIARWLRRHKTGRDTGRDRDLLRLQFGIPI